MGAWLTKASKIPEETEQDFAFDPTNYENVRKSLIRYHYRIGKNIEEDGPAKVHEGEN